MGHRKCKANAAPTNGGKKVEVEASAATVPGIRRSQMPAESSARESSNAFASLGRDTQSNASNDDNSNASNDNVVATEVVSFDEDADKELAYMSPDVATKNVLGQGWLSEKAEQAACLGDVGRVLTGLAGLARLVCSADVTDEETCSTASGEETPEDSEDSVPEKPVWLIGKPDLPISSIRADDQIIFGVAKLMKAMCRECEASVKKTGFQSVKMPTMSLSSFASRVKEYFRCTDECFVLTMVYIDRIIKRNPQFRWTDLTCHRLLLTSAMVAAKFHDDEYASNEYYARVGGIDTRELNALEAEFLQLLGWQLFVGATEYDWFLSTLRQEAVTR